MCKPTAIALAVALAYLSALARPARGQLTAGPDATVLLDGHPYAGIGVNYYDCFLRTLQRPGDTTYNAGFAGLAAKHVPFARFNCGGFWPVDLKLYRTDPAAYFRQLDAVVRSAHAHGVGLVPSLFWTAGTVPDLVGEPLDQWANPASNTRRFMADYVRQVVTRYRDDPTIWAWEFGNEYTLVANVPDPQLYRPPVRPARGTPTTRSTADDLTHDQVRGVFKAFAVEVRKYDQRRLIETGDGSLRPCAYHLERGGSWGQTDTPAQQATMLDSLNPDPIDCVSSHVYGGAEAGIAATAAECRRLGKPLFVAEFGFAGPTTPARVAAFHRTLDLLRDQHVPLAAVWVYDHADPDALNVTATGDKAWELDAIAAANRRLAAGR